MNFKRLFNPTNAPVSFTEAHARLYDHLKSLALTRWLPEARLLMARALQMTDPKEQLILRCIHGKEDLSRIHQDDLFRFTPDQIADWCKWYLPGRRRIPDREQVHPYLQQLMEKQLLVEIEGMYHTPEYVIDHATVVLYAPVIPQAEWLALHQVPDVMESTRLAGSGGRIWLDDLLKRGRV